MLEVRDRHGGSVVALMRVPRDQVHLYGCAAVEATGDGAAVRITDLVEKPPVEEAPSDLAVIGRYVLDPGVFDVLRRTDPGRGGEIQLTDALREMAASGEHGPCTASSSRAAATTPVTGSTTSRRSSASPATGRTWGRTSGPG
jgi:UTP--glucose-1-phosphate uridylyltransferase